MPQEQPKFDPDTQLKLAEVQLSFQVQDFLRTPIGRYIAGRADNQMQQGIEEFREVNPDDTKAVRAIQNKINTPQMIIDWLNDALVAGKNAEEQLRRQDDQQD